MPRFNPNDYQDVQARLDILHRDYPDARVITENLTTSSDRSVSTWVVKASLYLSAGDQSMGLAKATGHAFEIDGGTGANQTSALENGETSAVGRCLRLAGIGNGPSKQEMAKAERGITPQPHKDWLREADKMMNIDGMRWLYAQAKEAGAADSILEGLADRARLLSDESQSAGAGGSLQAGNSKAAKK
jgi:hypothetical protein